jgi:prepilin-type N-terminal cleavage/methylation domain-containing protein
MPKGFTLIEILFVVIILSILIAFSLPRLKDTYTNLELNNFVSNLQSYMNYLFGQSVVSGEAIYLHIDVESKQYWSAVLDSEIRLKTVTIPRDIKLITEQKQIGFYPDGDSDKVTIKVANAANQYVSLTTKGVFGSVKIQQGQ